MRKVEPLLITHNKKFLLLVKCSKSFSPTEDQMTYRSFVTCTIIHIGELSHMPL